MQSYEWNFNFLYKNRVKENFAIETREIEKTVKVIIFFIHLDISIRCRDIRIQSFSNFNRKQEDEF